MKIIKCLTEQIRDEIADAEAYIELANDWKEKEPETAELFAELSEEELGHMNRLHEKVTDLIREYREQHGEPSAGMMALYDYMHEQNIENVMRVKVKQAMYKEA